MRQDDDRSAALVIRVWHEPGTPPEEIRARITPAAETEAHGSVEFSAALGEEAILVAVRSWLREFGSR